jgi:mono/diheme cytochrome c family protein
MDTPRATGWRWDKILGWLGVLLVVVAGAAFYGWYKFFRDVPQEPWMTETPEMRFRYGSIGAENDAGIPYWIFYVLPRMFPEKLPKPGGYAALGVSWEQGRELPIGFTKKTIGFPRVANNCAGCHTTNYRADADANPVFINAGPGHTLNLEAFFRFLVDCAWRFLIIPMTKKRLLEREAQFAWIYRHDFPEWGRGRDDSMNLTKYFMIKLPMDDSFGPGDIPSIWNLKKYDVPGTTMNWSGDSHDSYSVIIDSALGLLGAPPKSNAAFLEQVKWLQDYLRNAPPPKYPFAIDQARAADGKAVFDKHCASCHASDKTGRRMPLATVGTDRERMDTWNKDNAIAANKVVGSMGIERKGLVETDLEGYNPPFLDGIWVRGPYLHNGSVPTLRDLLEPPAKRPKVFWRGYDLYDQENLGFIAQGTEAERIGTRFDTSERANGNGGHVFGVDLPPGEKNALLEYLKTI